MLTAITRAVSPGLAHCELSFIERIPIDMEKAREQHHAYEKTLAALGAKVISLSSEPELPDSMFVEDPAIVLMNWRLFFRLGRRRDGAKRNRWRERSHRFERLSMCCCRELWKAATFCASGKSFTWG